MTTRRRPPAAGSAPRRRSVLLGGIGGASTAALAALGHTGSTAAAEPAGQTAADAADFDFDTGNFVRDLIARFRPAEDVYGPMDVTVLHRFIHVSTAAWFDAMAPYHPTAVGVYSRIRRRPAGESTTNRNKNIAALHANYQVIKGVEPGRKTAFRDLMVAVGLDPDDESEDPTSPVGIGNLAGRAVLARTAHDGMNQLGDEGRTYNGRPYEDYTGYRPVNSAYGLTHPSRWQPNLGTHNRRLAGNAGDKGIFTVQAFVTPQQRLVRAHTFRDPRRFGLAPPEFSDHTRPREYKRAVDEVLAASAALTDEQKVKAEVFDNKFLGVGISVGAAAQAHGELDLDDLVHLLFGSTVAIFDALVAVWHHKTRYDAVRPFSAVRHVHGRRRVTAWGGPGKGTVHDMPGDEWTSYLNVGDHPEYPSGSACVCAAQAQATRRFFDDDVLDWTFRAPAGSTLVEPGLTPGDDLALHWGTWTDFVRDCADSRTWGGVHFLKTAERSIPFGEQFGDLAYEFVQRHVRGEAGG
ncbi:DUF6851 domain-containing protein [Streptomyces synnematoformans]